MGDKGRGKIRGEAGEVTGVVADAPVMDNLGKTYGAFGGWGMAAGKAEVLLIFSEFDMDRSVEVIYVDKSGKHLQQ